MLRWPNVTPETIPIAGSNVEQVGHLVPKPPDKEATTLRQTDCALRAVDRTMCGLLPEVNDVRTYTG